MAEKIRLLFLCSGNSCRSQIAEGWTRYLKGDRIEVCSAGIETHGLNESAVMVMGEAGVDISGHQSKHLDELDDLTLFAGGGRMIHVGFADPPALAESVAKRGGDRQAQLDCYRQVRDQIRAFVASLPESLEAYPK
jgi:arsenate reductase